MAHGYAKSKQPLAVFAHGTVGLPARLDGDLQRGGAIACRCT